MVIRRILCVLLFVSIVPALFAQDTIRGTYSYTYGDSESLVEARQTCKDLALREAIESYYIFVESSTSVEDFQLKEDLIQSIAAGYLKDVQIVEQAEEGRTITMTVEASVMPDEVQALVAQLAEPGEGEETESDAATDAASSSENLSPFMSALAEYGTRENTAESAWGRKQYQSALKQFQDLEAYLDKHKPSRSQPFYWNLFEAWKTRTSIQQDLIRVEHLESQNKRVRARGNVFLAVRKADELKSYLNVLEGMKSLTAAQTRLRETCVSKGRRTLARVQKKSNAYKRR